MGIRPDREPLQDRVEADETLIGGAKPSKSGCGAANKKVVAGAVETKPEQRRNRPLGQLRLQAIPDASTTSLEGFITDATEKPFTVATDGWAGYRGLDGKGYAHEPINLGQSPSRPAGRACFADRIDGPSWQSMGDGSLRLRAIRLVFTPRQALAPRYPPWRRPAQTPATLPRRGRLPLQLPDRKNHQPRLPRLIRHAVKTSPTTHRGIVQGAAA